MAVEVTALRTLFCVLVLVHIAAVIYAQDDQSGFISIDCGSESNYTNVLTGINYVSDEGFIEGGVNLGTSGIYNSSLRMYNSIRSFPENIRNCYTLRPQKGKNNRYLIRAMFYYGDARGQPPQFDLYTGADYWETVSIRNPALDVVYEMIHLTSSDFINVCLVNTHRGDPFISALELRLLDLTMYEDQSPSSLLFLRARDYFSAIKEIIRNLSSRGLTGEIATALANLTMIESLDLSYNNLTGNVPKFLAQLDKLRILNLRGNNFKRPLPTELLAKSTEGPLRLSIEESGGEDKSSWMHKLVVILAPIIGCIVVLPIIVFIVKQLKEKALIKRKKGFTPRKQQFTYSEVVGITNNFQNEIGRGGFGRVFLGCVGDNQVAVKMLSESSSQGYEEFQSEVKLLMEIHHTNITSLVGYCNESNHKAIIYEFMANGNLAKHLFDGCPNVLSWERRLQVGCDAAEGLAYIHHGCRPPIVHRDVKPSNILLNEGFRAKLADFWLSRAFPTEDATHVTSAKVAGTIGYLDPEYHLSYRLTEKSDVYSFGVVLLELITSRRAISDGINIIDWVTSTIDEGSVENVIDSRLQGCFNINTAWKVVETAIACVSPTPVKRPTMNDVVTPLKHCLQAEQTPQPKAASVNLVTMSNLDPR